MPLDMNDLVYPCDCTESIHLEVTSCHHHLDIVTWTPCDQAPVDEPCQKALRRVHRMLAQDHADGVATPANFFFVSPGVCQDCWSDRLDRQEAARREAVRKAAERAWEMGREGREERQEQVLLAGMGLAFLKFEEEQREEQEKEKKRQKEEKEGPERRTAGWREFLSKKKR